MYRSSSDADAHDSTPHAKAFAARARPAVTQVKIDKFDKIHAI